MKANIFKFSKNIKTILGKQIFKLNKNTKTIL